jgi:type VI secretion system protein VasG
MLIGAGGAAGGSDAASLLKPALARGELRTIAATTWSEYKKYFEKDPALTRRFQVVQVKEPSEAVAVDMLRGTVLNLEKHHNVRILDEAVIDAVKLSNRYITGRQLPDKAVSVLDTACARVAIGQTATPPQVEDIMRRIGLLELEIDILKREQASGQNHQERLKELGDELKKSLISREKLEKQWEKELALVRKIHAQLAEVENKAKGAKKKDKSHNEINSKMNRLKKQLAAMQGHEPMVPICVDTRVIASVVAGWTGIPVGKMMTDDIRQILTLKDKRRERIIGQSRALARTRWCG